MKTMRDFRFFNVRFCLFHLFLSTSLLILEGFSADSPAASERPNIIVILADDCGWGDVSCNNPDSKFPTPHIDRIAHEGMRFTDAHTSSGVCTPSRYSLLTGRYHWRSRLQQGVLGGFSRPLITEGRTTLASFLGSKGYDTICIGKWHLGMDWPLKDGSIADDGGDFTHPFPDVEKVDYRQTIQNGPVDRGFHQYFGISASLDMYPFVWVKDRLPTEVANTEKTWLRTGPAGKTFEAVDVQPTITQHLINYLHERAEKGEAGQPFFAYVPLASPHTPIVPTPEFEGKSGLNPYADFVLQIDSDIGKILDALENTGLAKNTLLVFTSDNGCSPSAKIGELKAVGHSVSGPYRGHKADVYEGGHRVPFLVRWPSKVGAGTTSDRLVGQLDLMATFADALGESLPDGAGGDSVSFLPALLGQEGWRGRSELIAQSIRGDFAIRDGKWKLLLCPGSGGWSYPRPGKDDTSSLPQMQMFDLNVDPGEQHNLIETEKARAGRMQAALEHTIAQGRSTPGPKLANEVPIEVIKPAPQPKPKAKLKLGAIERALIRIEG